MRSHSLVRRGIWIVGATLVGALLAACTSTPGSSASSGARHPGQALSSANVPGAGVLVIDGRGRTVYVLLDAQHRSVPCTSASGCTSAWPPVTVSSGAPAAKGTVQTAMVGVRAGQATYHGWALFEYAGDTANGEANGVGVSSYGGTWYALRPSGALVATKSAPSSGPNGSGW